MKKILAFAWDKDGGPWGKVPVDVKKPKKQEVAPAKRDVRSAQAHQPELEDVVNQMAERLKGFWKENNGSGGGGGGFNPFSGGAGGGAGGGLSGDKFQLGALVALILWLLSGFYIVAPEQQGVVTRFGAYVGTTDSGLNYHLPWPFEEVVKLPVTRVNQLEMGFRSGNDGGDAMDVPEESLMLTGDQNIVDLDFTVQWKIFSPSAFVFNVADPEGTLAEVAESVMRETVGRHPIDDALTSNKAVIQDETRDHLQAVLDYYGMGVQIVGVSLQQVNPPMEVIDAFRDVQAAAADKQRLMNEATGYANQIVPLARGEAAQMLQRAEGYKSAKMAEATGAAARFNAQVEAYQAAPAVTKQRLYMETMADVLKDTPKLVVTSKNAGNVLPLMPLDRLLKQPAAATMGKGE